MARVRKGDRVAILTGKDRGKEGRVIAVFPDDNRVLVEGVNRVKRHEKIRYSRGRGSQEGGIITKEMPVDLSNVAPVCASCGAPARVSYRENEDGTKSRVCSHCEGEV